MPHSWKKLIVNCGNSHKLGNDFGDYFRRILEKSNKYCNFIFTYNHVKDQNSRKLNALFWNGKVKCKHVSCNCSAELFIESEHEDVVKIMFEGDIHHDLHHREANDLKGEARQKMRKKLFSSPTTPTADMYRNNLADLDADVFAAGNRGNTETSPIVLQQVKAEIKASRCDTLPKDLVNLANKLTAEDKCLAKNFPFSKRHIFGYIDDVCVHPDLSVILTQQPLIRVYHQLVQRDILYFDATGSLDEKILSYKRILLYTLSLRHPYGKCTPLPIGQFVSSSHTASTIATFLAKFRECERVVMNGKNAMPRLIMMDQSTAIINACLKEFSKEDLPSYINRTFQIATGRANAEDLKKVLLHICFSHIMKTTKEDVKPLLVRCKKNVKNDIRKFVMLLFARLVECRSLEEMENIVRHSFIVLTTKKRNPRVQKSLTIIEKSIAEFPQLDSLVDDTDDDEDETRDEDSEHENDDHENPVMKNQIMDFWTRKIIEYKEKPGVTGEQTEDDGMSSTVDADEDEKKSDITGEYTGDDGMSSTVDADEDEKKSDITSVYTEDDGTSPTVDSDEDEKKCGIAGEQTEDDGMSSTVDGDEVEKKCGIACEQAEEDGMSSTVDGDEDEKKCGYAKVNAANNKYFLPRYFDILEKNRLPLCTLWSNISLGDLQRFSEEYIYEVPPFSVSAKNIFVNNSTNANSENLYSTLK